MNSERNESFDIQSSGGEIILDTEQDHRAAARVRGDAAASYALDVSDSPSSWITGVKTYSSTSDVDFSDYVEERFLRLRVTSGTGSSGDTADVLLSSSGDHH